MGYVYLPLYLNEFSLHRRQNYAALSYDYDLPSIGRVPLFPWLR
jgi:hypothetical protein